jgi:Flp pilus assembly protein CpaB
MRADFWKKMVSVTSQPAGLGIDQQRLVVAALDLPFLDRLRRHPLDAQLHARHVVRRIDDEEQRKGDRFTPIRMGSA